MVCQREEFLRAPLASHFLRALTGGIKNITAEEVTSVMLRRPTVVHAEWRNAGKREF